MSGLQCPHCGKSIELFQAGGGQLIAEREGLRLLGSLPIEPEVVKQGDAGNLSFLDNEQLPFTKRMDSVVEAVVAGSTTEPSQKTPGIEPNQKSDNTAVI
jgi:hypothetical protein